MENFQTKTPEKFTRHLLLIPFICVSIISLVLYWILNTFGARSWRPREGVASKEHPFLQFFNLIDVVLFCVCFYFIFRTEITARIIELNIIFFFKLLLIIFIFVIVLNISKISASGKWKEWSLLNKIANKFSDFQKDIQNNRGNDYY